MSDDRPTTATEAPSRKQQERDENGKFAAFEPTPEQRDRVRNLAKAFPPNGEHLLARMMGISRSTLREHFLAELEQGRAELIASVAAQEIALAMNAKSPVAIGDPQARRFILTKFGGWINKVEVGAPGAFDNSGVDLSRLTPEQLADYGRLSAIAEGLDPDTLIATVIGELS